jgi:4-hydroxy-tetrahydrodipicolinate synthase
MPLFHGLSAFPLTPTDHVGVVDTQALAALLGRLADAGVDSIGLLGSTGSYAYLTRVERQRAIRVAVDILGGRVPLVVGVGALRTDEAVELARDAELLAADGLLLAPMSYTPLSEEEVLQHFATVAAATALPLCVYNNPRTTHFAISDDLLAQLASIPGIMAVKNPAVPADEAAARHAALTARVPDSFALGYSGDWDAGAALLAGGRAWYSVAGGLLPEPCLKLTRAAQAGDDAEVARINALFQPLWSLFKELSSYRVIYAAANALGITDAQPPRPILPLSAEDQARVVAAVRELAAV